MASADRLEQQAQQKRAAAAATRPAAVPTPVRAAVPAAPATRAAIPTASRPTTAPTVANPQRSALATMGAADRMEAQATARATGTSVADASKRINANVQANLAMQGTRSSRPAGGSADRMETAQAAKIYGVSQGEAQKIINTQVDVQRASKGLPPVYNPNQKVSRIPAPLVQSSGRGSLASGWQSTGPVSATTGNPLIPNLPRLDASQDLRTQMRGGQTGGQTYTEENGSPESDDTETPEDALRQALATMRGTESATGSEFSNLLAPIGAPPTRRVQQIEGPGATIRQLQPFMSSAPARRRSLFGMM